MNRKNRWSNFGSVEISRSYTFENYMEPLYRGKGEKEIINLSSSWIVAIG